MPFLGSYLLVSLNPTRKGRTYIGFTVNPERRLRQHNGELTAGAKACEGRRLVFTLLLSEHDCVKHKKQQPKSPLDRKI